MVDGNDTEPKHRAPPAWETNDGVLVDGNGWVLPILSHRPEIQRIAIHTGMTPRQVADHVTGIWQWSAQFDEPHPVRQYWTWIPGMTLHRVQHNVRFNRLSADFWVAYTNEGWGGFEDDGFTINRLWGLFTRSSEQAAWLRHKEHALRASRTKEMT